MLKENPEYKTTRADWISECLQCKTIIIFSLGRELVAGLLRCSTGIMVYGKRFDRIPIHSIHIILYPFIYEISE